MRKGVVLIVCLALAACSSATLHSGLTEKEANELIAALKRVNITAQKKTDDKKVWAVTVEQQDFPEAVDAMSAEGLPKPHFESLGNVFKKEGFVSSPREENARLVYGVSQELSESLSDLDGVVRARVHLSIPDKDPLSETIPEPSASIILQHYPGSDVTRHLNAIKRLVAASVDGLRPDNVTVAMFPASEPKAVSRPIKSIPVVAILGGVVVLLGAAIILGPAVIKSLGKRRGTVL